MKPSKYMLSVQWGSGHHYFLGTCYKDLLTVKHAREYTQTSLTARSKGKRGAKPTVYAWAKLS